MRAAIFEGWDSPLKIKEVPRPVPGPQQAIIRVLACGICGSDLHDTEKAGNATIGGILGHEIAGEIVEFGADPVGDWKLGDRVFAMPEVACGHCHHCLLDLPEQCPNITWLGGLTMPDDPVPHHPGGYAEYMMVGTVNMVLIPDNVPTDLAALVEPLVTGLSCVRDADLKVGDRLAVLGAGPIGQAVIIWARFFGARRIVVSEPVASRRDLALKNGATDVFDPSAGVDPAEALSEIVGGPIDVVIEAAGRHGMLDHAVSIVREHGRIVAAGYFTEPEVFDLTAALLNDVTIRTPGSAYTKVECAFVLEMMAAGRLDVTPLITDRINLDELPAAFQALRKPTHECKVLVMP